MTTTSQAKNTTFVNGPLPILLSCRVRLNDAQRKTLRDAFNAAELAPTPLAAAPFDSSTSTETRQYGNKNLLPRLFSDIVSSRDTIALTALLELQRDLGVTVIDRQSVSTAAQAYVNYVFSES